MVDVIKLPDWYVWLSPGLRIGFLPTIAAPLMYCDRLIAS